MMLTVVPEHLVTAEGAVAKPDVAHPKLAHSERSELVGRIAEPGQRSTAQGGQRQRQRLTIDAFS